MRGTPVSSSEFEELIAQLKSNFRCVAIDHLGFGGSDKPETGDYSLGAHRKRLDALLTHLGVKEYHLVVTDFGGPIALSLAATHWNRVLSITLMNTWGWLLQEEEPQLVKQRWVMQSRQMKFLYSRFSSSPRILIPAAWGTHRPLPRERHQYSMSRFRTPDERMGCIDFLSALFDSKDSTWTVANEMATLPKKPTLLALGYG